MGTRLGLGVILIASGLALAADSPEAIFQKAAAALQAEDYRAAEQGFQAVLKLEPRNLGAMGNLGVVYSRTRRFSQAIEIYKRALRLAPGEKFLSTNLGIAYVKQEQYSAALPIFEKLAADPANLQARELLVTCRIALGQYEQALDILNALLQAEPGNASALSMRGVALTRLNRTGEAHQAFAKMMAAVSPAQANFLMGKASYETERFTEAADFFRKALALDPDLAGGHRELGKTLVSLHDEENAEKELRAAGPDDAEALYFLGGMLSKVRGEEAIPILEKARSLAPDLWGPPYYLGRIYADQGRVKDALPLLDRAARLNPEEPAVQYQLSRALQKLGREPEAQAAMARFRELKSKPARVGGAP